MHCALRKRLEAMYYVLTFSSLSPLSFLLSFIMILIPYPTYLYYPPTTGQKEEKGRRRRERVFGERRLLQCVREIESEE